MATRLVSADVDTFELDPRFKATDENLPERLGATALSATIAESPAVTSKAPLAPAMLAPGALWGFLGDSITNGSNASNFAYSYVSQSTRFAGGMIARPDSVEAGTPGNKSADALVRLPNLLARGVEAVVVLLGANDAAQAVTLDDFKTNIIAIIEQAKAAGCPVVLCTVPPRSAATDAAIRSRIDGYNDWLRIAAPAYGCELADVYSALVDTTTGAFIPAYDADGTHPTDLGHTKMASEVGKAMRRAWGAPTAIGMVRSKSPANLITDPLVVGGTIRPAGWFEQPGGTGTAPTYSLVADTSGVLPAGRWAQMDFDATASGGLRRLSSHSMTTGWVAGDKLFYAAHIQIEDVTGTWTEDVVAGTASVSLMIVNSNTGVAIPGPTPLQRTAGIPAGGGIYNIGPILAPVDAPGGGATSMNLWLEVKLPTGKRVKARIGCIGVINATARGSAAEFNWGPAIVNTSD